MNKISELKAILSKTFSWNKARLDCFAKMLLALFAVRTVNLSELAVAFPSRAKPSSRYIRLQRFFRHFCFDYATLARWIFSLFFSGDTAVYLSIDRSHWYWGKSKINIFVLGVAYESLAIPLIWKALPKAGSSNFNEQKTLINRFLTRFTHIKMAGLLADREFANGPLFSWLKKKISLFTSALRKAAYCALKTKN